MGLPFVLSELGSCDRQARLEPTTAPGHAL